MQTPTVRRKGAQLASRQPMTNHRSPWQPLALARGANESPVRALDREASVDICVVGAGMAGLLCALELAERGRSVIVVDRSGVGAGDTAMTTAHLTALLDTRYRALATMHGAEATRDIAAGHLRALSHLERVANAHQIDCEFRRVSGFLCARRDQALDLAEEHQAASEAGIACELIRRPPLAIADGPALHVPNQAQFEPLKFLRGVERALQRHGVPIYAPVTIQGFDARNAADQVCLRTSEGGIIRASHVVVATGSPVNDVATMHTKQAAYRTYAISVGIEESRPGLYWDMEDPYHYVRMATDHLTQQQVLVVGGEDHRVGQDPDNEARFLSLEGWLRDRFPRAGDIVSRWSGQVLEPSDGLGFIGRNPGDERVFIVTGESGNGMTYSALAAQLIADLVHGVPTSLERVFAPRRKPLSVAAVGDFVRENLNTAAQYSDWVLPGDVARSEDVPRGQGAVVRRGLRRIAVYMDESGVAHELSATCPHLGEVVAWNPAEKSWDCPCHGSRFDCRGRVLEGPAVSDLRPADSDARDAKRDPAV